ncbi:hypothetical protein PCASD_06359 [Puccinia coronata f. sp. avenae]|uniref:L-2-hydroxyglutarate dehydrogenase, mitochondrial n=1 Tax=Puccinia coronata f. sp. avenae TaxID=200324 RepID=A0A2N5UX80_9BASI|nr:hypothetical protein PCASD_06359 [Puccinia coronata f. sp. avenae]
MAATTLSRLRHHFPFIPPEATVDHLVIGAGVVGLAVGRELIHKFRDRSTFVVERNHQPGQETSSRNSEVIHAGIYYPQDSLKTALCLRGRRLMYDYCRKYNVPHKKIGKLIIARTKDESDYLEKLYGKCQAMNADEGLRRAVMFGRMEGRDGDLAPLRMMDQAETLVLEPDLSPAIRSSLFSAETGIVDSHAFITSLETSIDSSENGEIVYGTRVVRIDPAHDNSPGWVVQTQTNTDQPGDTGGERNSVLARCLVNCAGLNAHNIYNHVLYPTARRLQLGFCKGSYYSYGSAEGVSSVQHLIYPTPTQQKCTGDSFAGLGTHLTLDMNRKIKFGPDVEWLNTQMIQAHITRESGLHAKDDPRVSQEEVQDFWSTLLLPNDQRLESTYSFVKSYLPGVDRDHFSPDYSGIRPKLRTMDAEQNEENATVLRSGRRGEQGEVSLDDFQISQPDRGMINLLGIESPGLTSSLAIAEQVARMVQEDSGMAPRTSKPSSRQDRVSAPGHLNDWA